MEEQSGEKEFDPTERRLEDARRKGDIAIGRDLQVAAGTLGLLLAAWLFPQGVTGLSRSLAILLEQADSLSWQPDSNLPAQILPAMARALLPLLPWFVLPALLILLVLVSQRGLAFATDRITPKLNRISPLAGFKKRFGRAGLMEFLRNTLKMTLICSLLVYWLMLQTDTLIQAAALPVGQIVLLGISQLGGLLLWILALQAIIGLADLAWQKFEHRRKLRMSRKDMMDELKQSEGDPHVKALRRRRAEEIATNRMLADVARANVVVVNPEHYAVALLWQRGSAHAPLCLAKGTDELAARIREAALRANVPIRRDPPTARALYASVKVGEEIRPEHYRAVAAAIRYAEGLRSRRQRSR